MIEITGKELVDAALFIGVLVVSVILHEVSHGVVAHRLGDPTAHRMGRLTLNPGPHIDPIGSVVLPAMLAFSGQPVFGWAKPVPVDAGNLANPVRGMAMVGVAGPLTNLILAWLGAQAIDLVSGVPRRLLGAFILVNVVLAVFNMLPIPPLDGSRLLMLVLPAAGRQLLRRIEPYGILILFGWIFLLRGRGMEGFSVVIEWVLGLLV